MRVMVCASRSMIEPSFWVRCINLSPFTETVLRTGSVALFEKTPAAFIMLAIIPPVMVLVCW